MLVKVSVEVSPPLLVVTATCEEGLRTAPPKLQVISGTGSPMAIQEKMAVPPLAVTVSLGC